MSKEMTWIPSKVGVRGSFVGGYWENVEDKSFHDIKTAERNRDLKLKK